MTEYQQYLDEKLHQMRAVCLSQWDYVTYADLNTWLEDNFNDDLEGRYYATKILLHTLYYKKKDMEKLLQHGLDELIYGEMVKKQLVEEKNIFLAPSEALARVEKYKESTLFMPLLDSNKPHESGNTMISSLVHKLNNVKPEQVDFHWNIDKEKLSKYKTLICVDDCIGSGNQLKRFWKSEKILQIRKMCEELGVKIFYLVLIGYDKNLSKLKEAKELTGIEIVVCDLLTDSNRVFAPENIIWSKKEDERQKAIDYFEKLKKRKGISFLGFQRLDFAVILHDRVPNWTLPILWKEVVGWKYLVKRKGSAQ
jgi:hypothetical protein